MGRAISAMEISRAGWLLSCLCLSVLIQPVTSEDVETLDPVVNTAELAKVGTVQSRPPPSANEFMEVRGDYKLVATRADGLDRDLGESKGLEQHASATEYRRNYDVRSEQGQVFLDPRDNYELGESGQDNPQTLRQMAEREKELENIQETQQLKASVQTLSAQIRRREEEAASPTASKVLKAQLKQEIAGLKQQRKEAELAQTLKLTKQHGGNVAAAKAALAKVSEEGKLLKEKMQAIKDNAPEQVNAQVSTDSPPALEQNNHLKRKYETVGHRYCKHKVFTTSLAGNSDEAAPRCKQCINNNYFLVPDANEEAASIGTCYPVASYARWVDAVGKAKTDESLNMFCAKFWTKKGATFERKNGKFVKDYSFDQDNGNPNAFGFVCTAATRSTETASYSTWDSTEKAFRIRIISYTIARFTECHTADPESRDLTCVKKKLLGSCRHYSVGADERLHDKEWGQTFALLPVSNSFGQSALQPFGRRETEKEWTARALKHANTLFEKYRGVNEVKRAQQDNGKPYASDEFDFIGGEYGLAYCSRSWKERLVGLL